MARLSEFEMAIVRAWSVLDVKGVTATPAEVAAQLLAMGTVATEHDVAGKLAELTLRGQIPSQEVGAA